MNNKMVTILKYLFCCVHSMVSMKGVHKDKNIELWDLEWISLAARNIEILGKIEV